MHEVENTHIHIQHDWIKTSTTNSTKQKNLHPNKMYSFEWILLVFVQNCIWSVHHSGLFSIKSDELLAHTRAKAMDEKWIRYNEQRNTQNKCQIWNCLWQRAKELFHYLNLCKTGFIPFRFCFLVFIFFPFILLQKKNNKCLQDEIVKWCSFSLAKYATWKWTL